MRRKNHGQIAFRPDIEGLRAVAVVIVILSHVGLSGFEGGFVGVDIFFVISGFLITGLLLREYANGTESSKAILSGRHGIGKISIAQFYFRRARRILPAATVCLIVTFGGASLLLNEGQVANAATDVIWAALFATNFRLIEQSTDYFQQGFDPSLVQQYWSLAVEEQFYLLWPMLLLLAISGHGLVIRNKHINWKFRVLALAITLTAVSFVWSVYATASSPESAYFSPLTRAWELGLGVVGACVAMLCPNLRVRGASAWLGSAMAGLIISVVVIDATDAYPGLWAVIPTVSSATLLVVGSSYQGSIPLQLLAIAPMRFVGRISYSLYLWHWPVILLIGPRLSVPITSPVGALLILVLILAVSMVSYYAVESPFQRLSTADFRGGGLFGLNPRGAMAAIFSVVVLTVLSATAYSVNSPEESASAKISPYQGVSGDQSVDSRITSLSKPELDKFSAAWGDAVQAATNTNVVPTNLSPSLTELASNKGFQPSLCADETCTFGDGPKVAVVVGNSFSQMIGPVVANALDLSEWTVVVRYRSGCQIAALSECSDVFSFDHANLLILSDYSYGTETFNDEQVRVGYFQGVADLAKMADKTIVFGEPAPAESALIDCVGRDDEIGPACEGQLDEVVEKNDFKRSAANAANAEFIDLTDWLCDEGTCPAVIGASPVLVDKQHLEANLAAQQLAPLFRLWLLRHSDV